MSNREQGAIEDVLEIKSRLRQRDLEQERLALGEEVHNSNIVTVPSNPRVSGTKRLKPVPTDLDYAREKSDPIIDPPLNDTQIELFRNIQKWRAHVCVLHGPNCPLVDARPATVIDGGSDSDQLGIARPTIELEGKAYSGYLVSSAISKYAPAVEQQEHLCNEHVGFVKTKLREWKEEVDYRWTLENLFVKWHSARERLKEHRKISPEAWNWGIEAHGNKLRILESEKRNAWDELDGLLQKGRHNTSKPHLRSIAFEKVKEFNQRLGI